MQDKAMLGSNLSGIWGLAKDAAVSSGTAVFFSLNILWKTKALNPGVRGWPRK